MNEERIKLVTQIRPVGFDSITYYKDLILQDLKKDSDLLELFNNHDLSLSRPEDFINTNIFPFLKIPDTQSIVKNILCFDLDVTETLYKNEYKATYELIFRCLCHSDEVETPWGVNRHDLMAAIIKDRYCYSNILGPQLIKEVDKSYVAEGPYYYRVLKFHSTQNNDLRFVQQKNMLDGDRSKYEIK